MSDHLHRSNQHLYSDLAIAAILVVLNAVLTWMLELGLTRTILIAGVRVIVQLLLWSVRCLRPCSHSRHRH